MLIMVIATDHNDVTVVYEHDRNGQPLTPVTGRALAEDKTRTCPEVRLLRYDTVARWGPNGMPLQETA